MSLGESLEDTSRCHFLTPLPPLQTNKQINQKKKKGEFNQLFQPSAHAAAHDVGIEGTSGLRDLPVARMYMWDVVLP